MNDLALLRKRIDEGKKHYMTKQGELKMLNKNIELKQGQKEALEKSNETLLTKKMLIEESCSEARENGRELLSQISTSLVQAVFDENTEVKLEITPKDSIPTADVVVLNKYDTGMVEIDPSNSDGGGLADIVSLSLFMAVGQTVEDNFAPYVLDEPSKYVSKGDLSEKFAESFKNLVDYTEKQTIISTHDEFLLESGDTKYNIVKNWDTGISTVTKEGY